MVRSQATEPAGAGSFVSITQRGLPMSDVTPFLYKDQPVRFNGEGWLHATAVAERFGKRPNEWLRLPDTVAYLEAMERTCGKIPYVKTSRARADRGGGTWLHPKLAVAFARWLSPDFAVWCDMQIDRLLYGEMPVRQRFDRACTTLERGQQTAGVSARQLAEWRWRKPELELQVEHWRGQLQLMLGPDMD